MSDSGTSTGFPAGLMTRSASSSAKVFFPMTFSMEVIPGTLVAVTGETGSGKTTLLRLLMGLLTPSNGSMTLSGQSQVSISERTRSNFIYVPQGGSLFSGTIRENLLLGNASATESELMRVLQIASADFVSTLPDGLDTHLGEGGIGLSEGQAQRIAIARALLRPEILYWQGATSAFGSCYNSIPSLECVKIT